MDLALGGLASAVGVFAFFGGIALLAWIHSRENRRKRELEHVERMKALELGQSLPDAEVARATADMSRAWAAAVVGLVVPIALAGVSIAAMVLVFQHENAMVHLPLTCVIWGVSGLVSLITVVMSLSAIIPSVASAKQTGRQEDGLAERIQSY